MGVYQPSYLFIYLLFLGILYIPVCIFIVSKHKFNSIGILFIVLSIISYLVVGTYMVGGGYYADGGFVKDGYTSLLFTYGLPELILMPYPYIFIGLAVILGKKGVR